MKPDKHDVVVEAIKSLKKGEHQTTAIKFEFEADIEREVNLGEFWRGIAERLEEKLGLAYVSAEERFSNHKHDYITNYLTQGPLIYAEVYKDGSVDTEMTGTLLLDKPENILLLPKIQQIFRDVCEEYGSSFNTRNAGIHLALLNNKEGLYPAKKAQPYDATRFKNFRKSMIRLLPALYFLGSHDNISRELRFRIPQIERCETPTNGMYVHNSPKYSAIAFRHGSVEFRLFETCYDNPEVLLDYVVVMSNAMKFWTRGCTRNNLPRLKKPINFGIGDGEELNRMYLIPQHIDLLNSGLNILKPAYYSIRQLKKQRNFTVTRKTLNKKLKEIKITAINNYKEYEKRYSWELIYIEQNYMRRTAAQWSLSEGYHAPSGNVEDVLKRIQKDAKKAAKTQAPPKKKIREFINESIVDVTKEGGHWQLDEEDPPQSRSAVDPRISNIVVLDDIEGAF